jgi:hypothetical protein
MFDFGTEECLASNAPPDKLKNGSLLTDFNVRKALVFEWLTKVSFVLN